MDLVQPPARDYLSRRTGEIAAPLLQAYALFHHNTYDAGRECFVPANLVFDVQRLHAARCVHSRLHSVAHSCLGAEESGGTASVPAAFSLARVRRCTSACRYLRRFSGTMPGAANSRRSETVSSGRYERIEASGVDGWRRSASRTL